MDLYSLSEILENTSARFIPRYNDSPLIADGLREEIEAVVSAAPLDRFSRHLQSVLNFTSGMLLREIRTPGHKWTVNILTPENVLRFINSIESEDISMNRELDITNQTIRVCKEILGVTAPTVLPVMSLSPDSLRFFSNEIAVEAVQRLLVSARACGSTRPVRAPCISILSTELVLSDKYIVFHDTRSCSVTIGTYNMYMSALDAIRMRARVLIACDVYYPRSSLRQRLKDQWAWQEDWIYSLGNDGYGIAKQTEALCKSLLAARTSEVLLGDNVYKNMWKKIEEKLIKLVSSKERASELYSRGLAQFSRYTDNASDQELCELFGVQKCISHPFIYAAAGGRSAAKEALSYQYTDPLVKKELRACFMSMLVAGYISKERKWPHILFDHSAHETKLYTWYKAGYLNVRPDSFLMSDWDHANFGKNADLDTFSNYLDLVDDKAISFDREHLESYWNNAIEAPTHKRLLLEMFSKAGFSYRAVVDMVSEQEVPYKYKVVCLYPKEREMKVEARMFAIMTMEMRMFFSGLEANLADSIFPYLPEQTMTRDKMANIRDFLNITKQPATDATISVFLECDLSRWNLHWRKDVVDQIGHQLNLWFGVKNLFTYVHEFFRTSLIVVRTIKLRPEGIETGDPPASDLVWYNHEGGFEGIAQKLWTLATYAMIMRSLRHIPCSYILRGQGDNQVLSVVRERSTLGSPRSDYAALISELTDALQKGCAEVGQDLKPEECLEMTDMLTYSKEIFLRGAVRFTTLKFASRLFARSNESLPTINNELTGLHASCLALAEQSVQPLNAYILACFYTIHELHQRSLEDHPSIATVDSDVKRLLQDLNPDLYTGILWLPSAVGGLALSHISDYLQRGFGDPVSTQIAELWRAGTKNKLLQRIYSYVTDSSFYDPKADPVRLLKDPYCLPTYERPSLEAVISRHSEAYLESVMVNHDLKMLHSSEIVEYGKSIEKCLLSMTPFYPLIARDVYDFSAAGEREKISRMFTSTSTVQSMARESGSNITAELIALSGRELTAICNIIITAVIKGSDDPVSLNEARDDIFFLRSLWKSSGVNPEGLLALPPLLCDTYITTAPSARSGIKISLINRPDIEYCRGPYQPYLGSATKLQRSQHGYKIVGTGRVASALHGLQGIRSLENSTAKWKSLIDIIAKSRCDSIDDLDKIGNHTLSTNATHRFQGRDDTRGSYVIGAINLASHCVINTEEIKGISGAADDFPIMFQEFICRGIGLLNAHLHDEGYKNKYMELCFEIDDSVVGPINARTLDVLADNLPMPPSELKQSVFIHDASAWKIEIQGPRAVKGAVNEAPLPKELSEPVIISTLLAIIHDSGFHVGESHGVMEGSSLYSPELKLDLAEVKAYGARRILFSSAIYAALETGERLISELNGHDEVGKRETYVDRSCRAISASLSILFENPQLQDDPLITSFGYASFPVYDSVSSRPESVIYSRVRRLCSRILNGTLMLPIPFYVFQSERTGRGSSVFLAVCGILLYRSLARGRPWTQVRRIGTHKFLKAALHKSEESKKILYCLAWLTYLKTSEAVHPEEHKIAETAISNNLLVVLQCGHEKLSKDMRKMVSPILGTVEKTPRLLEGSYTELRTNPPVSLDISNLSPEELNYACRYWSHGSLHYAEWIHVLSQVNVNHLLLVGVGRGVAIAAALDLGCQQCLGFDLLDAYSLTDIRHSRPPPAIARHEYRKRFSWWFSEHDAMVRFPDKEVREKIASVIRKGTTVVIDVKPYMGLEDCLKALPEAYEDYYCLIRLAPGIRTAEAARGILMSSNQRWKIFSLGPDANPFIVACGIVRAGQRISTRSSETVGNHVKIHRGYIHASSRLIELMKNSHLEHLRVDLYRDSSQQTSAQLLIARSYSQLERGVTRASYHKWTQQLARLVVIHERDQIERGVSGAVTWTNEEIYHGLRKELFPDGVRITAKMKHYRDQFVLGALCYMYPLHS